METYLVPMWVVECGVQRDGCISMVKAADAQATVEALQAQLPAEMQGCTILFKECEKGHGRLVATNWRDHGCQTCEVEALQRERDGAYKQGFADALEKVASDWASKEFRGHDEIQGVEVQAFLDSRHVHYEECRGVKPLQAALDAEREKGERRMQENYDLTNEVERLSTQLTQLQALVRAAAVQIEQVEGELHTALNGARHDPSWIRPIQLSRNERQELYLSCERQLKAIRATLGATTPARWTAEEIEQAKREAKELGEAIGWPKGGDDE